MNDKNAKDKIIETSIRMIEHQDYNKITTNHIARKAGVSIGTLYYHFEKGKPDIIKEIVKRGYAEFLDETNLKNLTLKRLPEFLKSFLMRYLEQHRQNESFLIAAEAAFLSNRKLFKDYEYIQNELKLVPLVSNVLKRLGYPEKKDLDEISKFLLFLIDSIIHRHIIYEGLFFNDEELISYLADIILTFIKEDL